MSPSWKETLKRCFGVMDGRFAGHPVELENARELDRELRQSEVGWDELEGAVIELLTARGFNEEHIQEQIGRMSTVRWRRS